MAAESEDGAVEAAVEDAPEAEAAGAAVDVLEAAVPAENGNTLQFTS